MKKKAFGIVLLVLAALVLLQGNFGIPSLGGQIWPLLGIAFFAYQNGKKWWYDGEKTIMTDKEVAFGSGTFYKQDQDLVDDQVEVAFGNAKIYYDNAEMLGDSATLKVEVGFGNAVIYVPQHWRVDLKVETFCGVAKADTSLAPTSKTLIIRGDVAFGKLGIVYVK